jgi:hypothetical protein
MVGQSTVNATSPLPKTSFYVAKFVFLTLSGAGIGACGACVEIAISRVAAGAVRVGLLFGIGVYAHRTVVDGEADAVCGCDADLKRDG